MKRQTNALFALLVLVCLVIFSFSRYWEKKQVIEWDVTIYYAYLPAIFIYDDLKFENISTDEWAKRQFYLNTDTAGNNYLKMTSGLAFLYSPFFVGAHLFATNSQAFPADGFSVPYRFALLLSALFFTLWGLHFLRMVLQRFFSPWIAVLGVILIYCGSNLPYYSFVEPMTHAYNFFLVSLILWAFFKYFNKPRWALAALIGLASGLLTLIRPTDILVLLFPVAYWLFSRKRPTLKTMAPHLLLAGVLGALMISPQLFYWHYATGNWVVYSYNDESFFFHDPEIWKGYFSYRKGWFVYAPILWFSLPGFILLARHRAKRPLVLGMVLTVLAASWVTFSWWCWWYGGGFGARPMIEFLPLMALALAATLQAVSGLKVYWKAPAIAALVFVTGWSIFMNKQYKSQIFHWDSMSKELFWAQFFKDHFVENYNQLTDPPDYEAAKQNKNVN